MKLGPYELNQIYTGDARVLAENIPDNSIDLIFTDPPYPKEYLYLYKWLAGEAARILKPGGSCLAYTALISMDQIMTWFSASLNYYWVNCYYNLSVTQVANYWPKKLRIRWKPIIWYVKGERIASAFVETGLSGAISDKRFHRWGQTAYPALYWIEQLTDTNAIIWEPFTGGGTVPAVCKMLGRNYLAFEIDPDTAELARERVRNTQPPLFVPKPEQLTIF